MLALRKVPCFGIPDSEFETDFSDGGLQTADVDLVATLTSTQKPFAIFPCLSHVREPARDGGRVGIS